MVGYGVLVPIIITGFAVRSWIIEDATWFNISRRGEEFELKDQAAKYMACAFFGGALFMHFRWFWGLMGFERIARAGVAIVLYLSVGALLASLGFAIAGE